MNRRRAHENPRAASPPRVSWPACLWVALALLSASVRGNARAEPAPGTENAQREGGEGRWVVVPSTVGHTGNPGHAARKAAQLLTAELEAQGQRVLSKDQAKKLFEQRGSAPPMLANTSDIDELARDAQQALYHVASGLHSRARKDVERAMERARRALESLNRDARAAKHLLDACLHLVRAQLERNERAEARRQALECRRMVPDIDPDAATHPPYVIGMLAEAQADLMATEPSSLRIESDPMGCAAVINGRNLGTTPKELPRLPPGEYRVQVECHEGEPGRVHRAMLRNNRVVLRIDTRFDRVVQTVFDLSLRYQDTAEERAHRVPDALEAARVVGGSDLLLVWLAEPEDPRGAGRTGLTVPSR